MRKRAPWRTHARAPAGTAAPWLWGVLPTGRRSRASFRTVAIATIATADAESSKVRRICHRDMCNRMPRSDSEIARPCRAIGEGIDKRDKLLPELACTASPVAMVITTPLALTGMLHAGNGARRVWNARPDRGDSRHFFSAERPRSLAPRLDLRVNFLEIERYFVIENVSDISPFFFNSIFKKVSLNLEPPRTFSFPK